MNVTYLSGLTDVTGHPVRKYSQILLVSKPYAPFKDSYKKAADFYRQLTLVFTAAIVGFAGFQALGMRRQGFVIFVTISQMQQLFYLSCQDLQLTNHLAYFFKGLRILQLEFSTFSNYLIRFQLLDPDSLRTNVYNANLYQIAQFKYHSFVMNCYSKLLLWGYFLVCILAMAVLEMLLQECTSWRSKVLTRLISMFRYTWLLLLFQASVVPFGMSAALTLSSVFEDVKYD